MEDAVDAHHAEYDVAGVGGDFDNHIAAAVEGAQYLLNLLLLMVFDGYNYLLDVVLLNELFHVGHRPQAWNYRREAAFRSGLTVAVHRYESDEHIA